MENKIYIHKKGVLKINPIWVSLNKGKNKLYISNPIVLSTNERENTLKLKEMSFLHSKKIDVIVDKPSVSLEIQISKLDKWLRIGTLIVALSIMLYIMLPWRIMPTIALSYILFGYLGLYAIALYIFKRKNYFDVKY